MVAVMAVTSMLGPRRLAAQSAEQLWVSSTVVTLPPAPDPFVRYTTPGQCVQAASRLDMLYWRDKRPDTVVYAPATDSVPASVVAAARACMTRFTVETTPVPELRRLAVLSLWAGNDTVARRAIGRLVRVGSAPWTADRGWQLWLWIDALYTARPTRMQDARTAMAQLDALGSRAALWRVFAHTRAADYNLSVNDRTTAMAEARAALAASRLVPSNERIDWVYRLAQPYRVAASILALTRGGPAALAILDTMATDLTPLRPAGSSDQQRLADGFRQDRNLFEHLGMRNVPRVHADAWYGATCDTVRPRAGKLTLLVFLYGPSYPMFATLNRLHAKYGATGLDIVFMSTTRGYFRDMPMLVPKVESDSMGSYQQQFLKLPGPLAMETTSFIHIADGRRRDQPTENLKTYGQMGGYVLVDRSGVVRWIDDIRPNTEPVWNAVIEDALVQRFPTVGVR